MLRVDSVERRVKRAELREVQVDNDSQHGVCVMLINMA